MDEKKQSIRETACRGIYDGNLVLRRSFAVTLVEQTFIVHESLFFGRNGGIFIYLTVNEITAVYLRPSAFSFNLGIEVGWKDSFNQPHQFIFATSKTDPWLAAFREQGANVVAHPPPMKRWPTTTKYSFFPKQIETNPQTETLQQSQSTYWVLRIVIVLLVVGLIVVANI